MQSGPINFNTTKAIFRAPHIEVAWRDAAPCCATYLLIICRINAESPPPPTLHLLSIGVHTSIETLKGNSYSGFPALTLTANLFLCPQVPCLRQACCGLFFSYLVGVGSPNPSDEWIADLQEGEGI